MQVKIVRSEREGSDRFVVVDLNEKPANLPRWVQIRPDDERRPLVTDDEPRHPFDHSLASAVSPKDLVDTARAYLDGEMSVEAAEAAIHAALIAWSSAARQ